MDLGLQKWIKPSPYLGGAYKRQEWFQSGVSTPGGLQDKPLITGRNIKTFLSVCKRKFKIIKNKSVGYKIQSCPMQINWDLLVTHVGSGALTLSHLAWGILRKVVRT